MEVGPGLGALTDFLVEVPLSSSEGRFRMLEIDAYFFSKLKHRFKDFGGRSVIHGDFLQADLVGLFGGKSFALVGNFPYNISTQMLIRAVDNSYVSHILGIFQKEVGLRVTASHSTKSYGMLSVWVQNCFEVEYLFDLPSEVFDPPPAVQSGVIRLKRRTRPVVDSPNFFRVTKIAFAHKRKTLRNNFKAVLGISKVDKLPFLNRRAEQCSIEDFSVLTEFLTGIL